MKISFLGILFIYGYNFIGTVFRSIGDSKTPLYFVLIAVICNAIIDPIFIAGFGWGIKGAAIATVFSQALAFLIGAIYTYRHKLVPLVKPHLPAKNEIFTILKLGVPAGLQMSVISAGSMAIMGVVTSFGSPVVAGYGAAKRLDSIIMLPAQALGTSVNSMAGQNIGAGNWKRVHKITLYGFIYNVIFMLGFAVLIFLFADYGIKLFLQEAQAVDFGTKYLKIIAFFYPFLGINFILNGTVRASGAMFQVLVLNFISFWILRFPLTSIFAQRFGENGIGLGMGLSFLVSSIVAFLYYQFGKWRHKDLIREK